MCGIASGLVRCPARGLLRRSGRLRIKAALPMLFGSWSGRPRRRARTSSNFLQPKAWVRAATQSMSDEQIQAACGEAKRVGLRAAVHAISSGGAKAAVLAGCTSIEHGDFLDDEILELMSQRGTYFDLNFLVLHNYIDNRASFPNISDDGIAALQRAIDPTADVLRRAHAHHVKIVFG